MFPFGASGRGKGGETLFAPKRSKSPSDKCPRTTQGQVPPVQGQLDVQRHPKPRFQGQLDVQGFLKWPFQGLLDVPGASKLPCQCQLDVQGLPKLPFQGQLHCQVHLNVNGTCTAEATKRAKTCASTADRQCYLPRRSNITGQNFCVCN